MGRPRVQGFRFLGPGPMCLGAIVPLPPKARCPAAQHASADDEEILCKVPFGVTLQGFRA